MRVRGTSSFLGMIQNISWNLWICQCSWQTRTKILKSPGSHNMPFVSIVTALPMFNNGDMWCSESTRSLGDTFDLWPLTVKHSCAVNRDGARRVVAFMIFTRETGQYCFFVFFILYVIFPFPRSLCKRKEKVSNTFRSLLSEFSRVLFLNSSGNRQSPPPFKSATQKY